MNYKFKMENLSTALRLLKPNYYMSTIDLKDAYYAVPIHKDSKKILRFNWDNQIYEFQCLPFGLCTAPRVFTKLMKVVVTYLRKQGVILVIYLDDILIAASSYAICKRYVSLTVDTLTRLGFLINWEKSRIKPGQVVKFLGFGIDTHAMKIFLPPDKIQKAFTRIANMLKLKVFTIQCLAELIGFLIAISPAIPYSMLHTKSLERLKVSALYRNDKNFNATTALDQTQKSDLLWWLSALKNPSNPIHNDSYVLEIFSDASLKGWGAFCRDQSISGVWNSEERNLHINQLELLAAYYGLRSFANSIENCQILLKIDNTCALHYINRMGSIKFTHLHSVTEKIWNFASDRKLWLKASYISSSENVMADYASRNINLETEWTLSSNAFLEITTEFGLPEIDLFASYNNAKCSIFASWKPDPMSTYVDAFTIKWDLFSYIFPPFNLISRVLNKMFTDSSHCIVVVPNWESQPWFPLFMSMLASKLIKFGPTNDLLTCNFSRHPLRKSLILMAGILCGNAGREEGCKNQQCKFYSHH